MTDVHPGQAHDFGHPLCYDDGCNVIAEEHIAKLEAENAKLKDVSVRDVVMYEAGLESAKLEAKQHIDALEAENAKLTDAESQFTEWWRVRAQAAEERMRILEAELAEHRIDERGCSVCYHEGYEAGEKFTEWWRVRAQRYRQALEEAEADRDWWHQVLHPLGDKAAVCRRCAALKETQ